MSKKTKKQQTEWAAPCCLLNKKKKFCSFPILIGRANVKTTETKNKILSHSFRILLLWFSFNSFHEYKILYDLNETQNKYRLLKTKIPKICNAFVKHTFCIENGRKI